MVVVIAVTIVAIFVLVLLLLPFYLFWQANSGGVNGLDGCSWPETPWWLATDFPAGILLFLPPASLALCWATILLPAAASYWLVDYLPATSFPAGRSSCQSLPYWLADDPPAGLLLYWIDHRPVSSQQDEEFQQTCFQHSLLALHWPSTSTTNINEAITKELTIFCQPCAQLTSNLSYVLWGMNECEWATQQKGNTFDEFSLIVTIISPYILVHPIPLSHLNPFSVTLLFQVLFLRMGYVLHSAFFSYISTNLFLKCSCGFLLYWRWWLVVVMGMSSSSSSFCRRSPPHHPFSSLASSSSLRSSSSYNSRGSRCGSAAVQSWYTAWRGWVGLFLTLLLDDILDWRRYLWLLYT